jgi:hypothetical protein
LEHASNGVLFVFAAFWRRNGIYLFIGRWYSEKSTVTAMWSLLCCHLAEMWYAGRTIFPTCRFRQSCSLPRWNIFMMHLRRMLRESGQRLDLMTCSCCRQDLAVLSRHSKSRYFGVGLVIRLYHIVILSCTWYYLYNAWQYYIVPLCLKMQIKLNFSKLDQLYKKRC